MSSTFKVFVEKLGRTDPSDYIGKKGEFWIDGDPDNGLSFRVSDGENPGGIEYSVSNMQERIDALESTPSGPSYETNLLFGVVNPINAHNGKRYAIFDGDSAQILIQPNMTGNVDAGYELDLCVTPTATVTITVDSAAFDVRWLDENLASANIVINGPAAIKLKKVINDTWYIVGKGVLAPE